MHTEYQCVLYYDYYKDREYTYTIENIQNYTVVVFGGDNGTDGGNSEGIQQPDEVLFINPIRIINEFKNYIRIYIGKNIWESIFYKFLNNLQNDERIKAFYDTLGFADEIRRIETQYYQLRNELPFVPIIQSVLIRISEYANSNVEPAENMLVLKLLYTTAMSKLCAIRNHRNPDSVLDLIKRLEVLEENIDKLNVMKEVDMISYQHELKTFLDHKIDLANRFIRIHMITQFDDFASTATDQILKLVTEIVNQKNRTENHRIELSEMFKYLENTTRTYMILTTVKMINSVLEFFGSFAANIVEIIGGASSISQAFYDDGEQFYSKENSREKNKFFGLIDALTDLLNKIKKVINYEYLLYAVQLEDMKTKLETIPRKWAEYIIPKVDELQSIISVDLSGGNELDPSKISRLRIDLEKMLTVNQPTSKSDWDVWNHLNDINQISNISMEIYTHIRDKSSMVKVFAESIRAIDNTYRKWDVGRGNIYHKCVPLIQQIQDKMLALNNSIANGEHVELDIPEGLEQNVLRDMKRILMEMAEWTTLESFLKLIIEKVDESFAMMIDVFDRFDSYAERCKFVAYYLSSLLIKKSSIYTHEMENVLLMSREAIHTNRVLEQYEIMMHTLGQHRFPFGHIDDNIFKLSNNLRFNDSKKLRKKTVDYIYFLKEQIKLSDVSFDENDQGLFAGVDFSKSNMTQANPFYIWKDHVIRDEVDKLLRGEEIIIKADITKGLPKNGLRFNEIGIQFKLVNESAQIKLYSVLENFHMRMTIIGNNYLRCGSRFYYVSVDDDIVIDYSLKTNSNGVPSKTNEIYRKIGQRGYFLSPHVMWKIQLIRGNFEPLKIGEGEFDELNIFENAIIDVRLTGRGLYYKGTNILSLDVYNKELDEFYNFDSTISIMNIDLLKFQYSF